MNSILQAIALNLAVMCMVCLVYLVVYPTLFLINQKMAEKLDRPFNIVLAFLLSWIGVLCVNLFFLWVTK